MRVRVLYMGMLQEAAGCQAEVLQLAEGASAGDLYEQAAQRHPRLQPFRNSVAVAVNYEYCEASRPLQDNDEVALIPPVSGGITAQEGAPLTSAHVTLLREPIDAPGLSTEIKRPEDGAVVLFEGTVRNNSRGRRTLYLDYAAYEPMALQQMERVAQQTLASFAIRDARIVHRLGRLEIGETSVLVVVAAAHRAPAFDACRWLIDTLKKTVPIWKKEFFEDGAVWADGEPFPAEIPMAGGSA